MEIFLPVIFWMEIFCRGYFDGDILTRDILTGYNMNLNPTAVDEI